MVFGFGKGKIEIFLEKYQFSPGDTIKGRIALKLKEPIRAKALKVGLVGERGGTTVSVGPGRMGAKRSSMRVYNFEMPLDGEKEYFEGEYNFEIKIPVGALPAPPGGVGGDILKSVQFLSGRVMKWYVIGKLDIPSGIDVSKKVQVNIG